MDIKCPICGKDAKYLYKLKSDIFYCKPCSLQFAPNINFNMEFSSSLDEAVRQNALKDLREGNFHRIIKNFKNHLRPNAVGLEVGSSYGWFIKIAEDNNYKCYGIEPEKKICDISIKNGFNVFNGFFPQDVPSDIKELDFIIFNDVFEHIPDTNLVLDKCYELLKEDGLLIINLPLSTGFFYKVSELLYHFKSETFLNRMWQTDFHSPHYYYFNKRSLKKILDMHMFNIVDYHKLNVLDPKSIKQRILMDKSSKSYHSVLAFLLKISFPFIKLLNDDIGCFYIKKKVQ